MMVVVVVGVGGCLSERDGKRQSLSFQRATLTFGKHLFGDASLTRCPGIMGLKRPDEVGASIKYTRLR